MSSSTLRSQHSGGHASVQGVVRFTMSTSEKPDSPKRKKKSTHLAQPAPFELSPPTGWQVKAPPCVRVRVCNLSLPHLNFEWPAVPVTLTVAAIKQAIIARHGGSLYNVSMWKDAVRTDTRVRPEEESLSLKALGVKGLASGEANILPLFTLHYDFDPVLCDDPIASVTCQTRESSVDLKTYLALRR